MILTAAAGNSLMEPPRRDGISKIVSKINILLSFFVIFESPLFHQPFQGACWKEIIIISY